MLFEQFGIYADAEDGAVVGLNVGIDQPAGKDEEARVHEAEEKLRTKHLMVQLAGLVANSRIKGVKPDHEGVPETIFQALENDAGAYTRYYFAFELLATLKRFDERIHSLSIQPIKVSGFEDCWTYLAQATRCWLFGLDAASAALSRVAVESALREAIRRSPDVVPRPDRKGKLLDLICGAYDLGILDNYSLQMAHKVRLTGNDILHGERAEDPASGGFLVQARAIVEHVVGTARG
jgi:hypothetical protein